MDWQPRSEKCETQADLQTDVPGVPGQVGDLASLALRPDLSHYVSAMYMYKYVCSFALGGFTKMHLGKIFRTTSMCVLLLLAGLLKCIWVTFCQPLDAEAFGSPVWNVRYSLGQQGCLLLNFFVETNHQALSKDKQ